jgi:hypothetical protein
MSFWSKLVHDSDLSISHNTSLLYAMALADRFSTLDEFLYADEQELISLGITDANNRACLLRKAHQLDDKVSYMIYFHVDILLLDSLCLEGKSCISIEEIANK